MLIYILKFSACLTIFLVFYKLFLERENMHQFKRFYLIGMVLASIVIPFVTFTQYIETQPVLDSFSATTLLPTDTVSIVETPTNYIPMILWSIYGIGVLLFGLKFGYNLVLMILKIKKNPKEKASNFINVLLKDLVAPHTFFSYIFLNKHKYETHQIPQEVLLHEQTHAKQKHSIDVLLIELLQVVFWFNPLIHILKNSIKLNHEFLADNAVLSKGVQANNYQHILLSFSSYSDDIQLANAINYSSIKKRLTVMKTHTSKQKMWLRSLVLLPLLALTLYGFSERKEVVKEISALNNNPILEIYHNPDVFKLNGKNTSLPQLKEDFLKATNNKKSDLKIVTVGGIKMSLIYKITEELKDNLIALNLAQGGYIIDDTFSNGNQQKTIKNQDGASREQMKEYNRLAKHYNSLPEKQRIIKQKDVERMEYIYHLMSAKQKKDAEAFPNIPPPPAPPTPPAPNVKEPQQPNSPPEPQEPNWLLINRKGQMLYNDDLATLKTLESQLEQLSINSDAVKVVSVKFEEGAPKEMAEKVLALMKKYGIKVIMPGAEDKFIPPPPPPPIPDNATKEQKEKYKKVVEEYNRKYTVKNGKVSVNPPPPPIPENATEPQRKKYEEATRLYKLRTEKKENELARVKKLKQEKMAYQEERAAKIKTEKGELTRDRKLRSEEKVLKLKQEKLAYQEARAAKLKTDKKALAQVKELRKKEDVLKLKEEKLAYVEAQQTKLKKENLKHVEGQKSLAKQNRVIEGKIIYKNEKLVGKLGVPNPPKSPLDHVIDMAKKNAVFYLEGKEISSDEAIKALKKNKHLNIQTLDSNSKQPKVYISKKPIVIDN